MGLSTDNVTNEKVREEAMEHGDMVVLPYLDSYKNLTYKYVYGIKWTIDNCPLVKYNMKLDDDMVIHLGKAFAYLENVSYSNGTEFHCTVFDRARPIRYWRSKWNVPRSIYSKKFYPKYCSGGALLVKTSALRGLYNASFSVPFFWIDDIFVTGMAAKIAGVGHVNLNEPYWYIKNDWDDVVKAKYMFAQIKNSQSRSKAWQIIMTELVSSQNNMTSFNGSEMS